MRTLDTSNCRGLNFSTIFHSEVYADITEAKEGDMFINYAIGQLIYFEFGFKMVTDNPNHYLSSDDLRHEFKKL
jgi:hypothetical protein